jgi:alpha-beta hydrolase superfamily lysophospholipase
MHGTEHWTTKGDVRLFLWRKAAPDAPSPPGTVLFVHGSSMASQPTFDLQVPGRPHSSVMDWFAARGFDAWCLDNEGYGRSDKKRPINFDISNGADDLAVASDFIFNQTKERKLLVYGISSGALKAALFAERHPERVARLALDDSVPTGTYVDMCSKLPLVDPARITVPTIVMRGQHDGIAEVDDLIEFFKRLPNPDKQFCVMPGISHASFQQKNYLMVYHILHAFFSQPEPVYRG